MSTMTVVCFCFYIFFMACSAAGPADIPNCSSDQRVTASVGDTALLPCHFSYRQSTNNLTVIWRKEMEEVKDIVVHNQSKHDTFNSQSATDSERTAMYKDWFQHKDATLIVARIRAVDAGDYSCWIDQSASPSFTYKCCAITLRVAQEWKGDKGQVVVAWSIYIIFLFLCLFLIHFFRQRISPPDGLFEI